MRIAALTAAAFALVATAAFADPHEDREAFMKENGRYLGQLAPVAKGEKAFDAEDVMATLAAYNEHVQSYDAEALFPEGSGEGNRAAPAIWENWDDFVQKGEDMKAAAAEAAAMTPASAQDVGAIMGIIGPTCQGCHETYRLPE